MLFSVIMPVYNGEAFLRDSVDSLLKQTYTDYEAILIDDGSTDESGRILDEYALIDERLQVIHKKNGGVVSARKCGMEIASGDYIANLDCDDVLAPDYLERFADAVQRTGADMCFCGHFRYADGKTAPVDMRTRQGTQGLLNRKQIDQEIMPALLRFRPTMWGVCIRRELCVKHQMQVDDRIKLGEDGQVVHPCISDANSIYLLPEKLYYYRIQNRSLIHTPGVLRNWENTALRLRCLETALPSDRFNLRGQMDCMATTAYFRSALSYYRCFGYAEATRKIRAFLAVPEVAAYFKRKPETKRIKVKIVHILMRLRLLFLLRAYVTYERCRKRIKAAWKG